MTSSLSPETILHNPREIERERPWRDRGRKERIFSLTWGIFSSRSTKKSFHSSVKIKSVDLTMARALSKALLSFVADNVSPAISRRAYAAAASQGVASSAVKSAPARSGAAMLKKPGEEVLGSTKTNAWVPDPVTGHYRPENLANEIDVAELRNMLLKRKH